MKAAVLTGYGPPERVRIAEVAHRYVETGEKIGNVVISVAGPAAQAR